MFAKLSSVLADDLDKAISVFDFADVQTFDIVVHFLRERFYHESNMCVLCGGQEYFIANNWFGDGGGLPANKRAFYNWLARKVHEKNSSPANKIAKT